MPSQGSVLTMRWLASIVACLRWATGQASCFHCLHEAGYSPVGGQVLLHAAIGISKTGAPTQPHSQRPPAEVSAVLSASGSVAKYSHKPASAVSGIILL